MKIDVTFHIASPKEILELKALVTHLTQQLSSLNEDFTAFRKELLTKMSDFTDALQQFQDEQAALLANVDKEIQQVLDAVNSGNTNAADITTGLAAIRAATQAAKDANAKLTADDSPVVQSVDL